MLDCKSCGGRLRKVGPVDFECEFCGTRYQIEISDTEAVKDLVEENSLRWMKINNLMDTFYKNVNQASIMKSALRKPWRALILANGCFLLFLIFLGKAFFDFMEKGTRAIMMKDFLPFFVFAGIAVVFNLYYYVQIYVARRRIFRKINQAQEIIREVIVTYQQMIEKKAGEIIDRLHDPKKITNLQVVNLAQEIYQRIIKEDIS